MKSSILVVDDSAFLHRLVRAYLQDEPLTIHSAYSGDEAIKRAATLRPHLILLDVDMPALNGFDVCRQLKANPITQNIPIIFLTAFSAPDEKVRGLDLGANDYITKPFKPEEFCARIRAAIRAQSNTDDLSMIDEITRLWNKSYLDRHLNARISFSRRANQPLTCVVADVDSLGAINDKFGEEAGDDVLRIVANILSGEVREQDIICSLGGGKFAALLPGTSRAGAIQFADRARLAIEHQLKSREGADLGGTCSFGVADAQADEESSILDLADAALYCAKKSGRNRVSVSRPTVAQVCATD
jgi:diguanylate cyclase (GGDEF)-like protein